MIMRTYRRASAIVFVLGLVFAASILGVYLVEYSVAELKPRVSAGWERELRTDAYSALNSAVAVLEEYYEIDGGLYAPSQGWEFPFADKRIALPDGADATVKIVDESGKIPLAELKSADLQKIFEEMKIPTSDAQKMADSIIDWTDNDDAALFNGAERDDYEDGEAVPTNRAMKSLTELRYVKTARDWFFDADGAPTERFKEFAKIVSVEDFSKVNLNSASPEVLYMLLLIGGKTYDSSVYQAIRGEIGSVSDGIVWIKNAEEASNRGASNVPSRLAACQPQLLKIEVSIRRGAGEYFLCAYYGEEQQQQTSDAASKKNASGGGNKTQGGQSSNTSSKTAIKSTSGGKQSDSTSSTTKSSASSSKSKNTASKKGGERKILKVVEMGS